MVRPTKEELLACVSRGGRIFLFNYPLREEGNLLKGSRSPSDAAQEKIENALFDLPGVKELGGPYVNGILAITVNDNKENAGDLSDEWYYEQIATIFFTYWREGKERT